MIKGERATRVAWRSYFEVEAKHNLASCNGQPHEMAFINVRMEHNRHDNILVEYTLDG